MAAVAQLTREPHTFTPPRPFRLPLPFGELPFGEFLPLGELGFLTLADPSVFAAANHFCAGGAAAVGGPERCSGRFFHSDVSIFGSEFRFVSEPAAG